MLLIPAIDLKDGKVVRLRQGSFQDETVYSDQPAEMALHWEAQGAKRLHVVDLEGALLGKPRNMKSIEKILKKVTVPIQVGGGIRSIDQARGLLEMGVFKVIFGTKACLDKGFLKEAILELGSSAIVAVDAKEGRVATDGWTQVTKISAKEMAMDVEKLGGNEIIYTDILKDGMLTGYPIDSLKEMLKSVSVNVIASGGVGSLKDIEKLGRLTQKNFTGVIIGKALYEGALSFREAKYLC